MASSAVAFCVGYVAGDFNVAMVDWFPRVVLVVAAVLLIVWITEVRVSRQLARNELEVVVQLSRIEARIEGGPTRPQYWQIYSDVLNDLSGVDGEETIDLGRHR